jgi:hypothetical protein
VNTIGDLAIELDPIWPLELNPESEKQNINVWIGQGKTIADTHYDAYENFNVQVENKSVFFVLSERFMVKRSGQCFHLIHLFICILIRIRVMRSVRLS